MIDPEINETFVARLETMALELHKLATDHQITLRFFGSLAIRLHCPSQKNLFDRHGRFPKDIDAVIKLRDRPAFSKLLHRAGWIENVGLTAATEGTRMFFEQANNGLHIDVCADKLRFCQVLDVSRRLDADQPTIPVADLLLSKLQIIQPTASDCIDVAVLLLEHSLGDGDNDQISYSRLADILSSSWSWYHSVEMNLNGLTAFVKNYDITTEVQKTTILNRISELRSYMISLPKTFFWRVRKLLGESVQWYSPISEIY